MEQNNIINSYLNKNRDQSGINNLTVFNGFNQNLFLDPSITGYSFVFVTKPSLFLYPQKPVATETNLMLAYNNMCKDPNFTLFINGENTNEKDAIILKQLSFAKFNTITSLFLPQFTNLATSFTPTDISLDNIVAYATREGYSFPVPTNKTASEASGTVSIAVTETDNLDFNKMMNIWVNYINNITNGTFTANPDMIDNNMLDYMCSIYYFMLGPDGRTIKYWCRYTGCYPTSVQYSNFSYQKGAHDAILLDIPFQYTLKEDMNPQILEDFNMVSLNMVTATFTNDNYSAFIKETADADELGYATYSRSALLSEEKLMNGIHSSTIFSDDRNPIVFFEKSKSSKVASDNTNDKYVLSFGADTLKNRIFNSLLSSSSYDYSELIDNL